MPLSPIDVTQQTFRVSLRGYDESEVDDFLEEVVSSMKEYDQRLRDADERVSVLEDQLQANRETEDAMRRAFVAAQRTADEIVAEARVEGERIVAEANAEAVEVSAEKMRERDDLQAELATLRSTVAEVKSRLEALARGMLPDLEALGSQFDAAPSEPSRPSLSARVAQLSSAEEVADHIPPFAPSSDPSPMADDYAGDFGEQTDLVERFPASDRQPVSESIEDAPRFGSHRATDEDADRSTPGSVSGGWLTSPNEPLPGRGMRGDDGDVSTSEIPAVDEDWSDDITDSMQATGWGSESSDDDEQAPEPETRRRPWER